MIMEHLNILHSDWIRYSQSYESIVWTDQPRCTKAEWEQAKLELQADHDAKQYQRDRAAVYPSWEDQLDNIFHNGIDAWKADIQAIKNQFPKP